MELHYVLDISPTATTTRREAHARLIGPFDDFDTLSTGTWTPMRADRHCAESAWQKGVTMTGRPRGKLEVLTSEHGGGKLAATAA